MQTLKLLKYIMQIITVTVILTLPSLGFTAKVHTFHFETASLKANRAPQGWSHQVVAGSRKEAYRKAAYDCAGRLKQNQRLSEEIIMKIVDVCANPRQ